MLSYKWQWGHRVVLHPFHTLGSFHLQRVLGEACTALMARHCITWDIVQNNMILHNHPALLLLHFVQMPFCCSVEPQQHLYLMDPQDLVPVITLYVNLENVKKLTIIRDIKNIIILKIRLYWYNILKETFITKFRHAYTHMYIKLNYI